MLQNQVFLDIWTANPCPLEHLKHLVRICAAIAVFVAMCVCCQIQLQKHSSSIPSNRANGVAVFEGSPIRYNAAIFLEIENLCFNGVLGLTTPLAPIHLETHLLSGVMLVCQASNQGSIPSEDRYCTARQLSPLRQKIMECLITGSDQSKPNHRIGPGCFGRA